MIFKNFHTNIIIRILLIVVTSLFMSWYFNKNGIDITLIVTLVLFILQVFNLINYTNRTNRLVSFFFDAVKNEDSTLVFNEKSGSKKFDLLNRSLNNLNKKLQDIRIDITVQEKYYKAVVESALTAIIVFNDERIIQLANSAARDMLGLSQLHNLNQIERTCPRLFDMLLEIEDGESRSINAEIGEVIKYLSITSVSIMLKNRKVKVVALNDISLELEKQEIDSWQKLIRILNHEIMNSVAPITSLSATLTGFFKKDDVYVNPENITEKTIANTIKGLSIIEEHGKGLISFVDSYRSLTKLPRPKPEEMLITDLFESVSVLASSVIDEHKNSTGKGFDISTQVNPPKLKIFADPELITRVVFNLVKNSIEAISGMDNAAIFLEAGQKRSGKVWIRVIDNGPGIPDEVVGNIFIPFFTTKEKGSGIGLSLSKQIITMHKGSLNVFSNPDEGTTMLITI